MSPIPLTETQMAELFRLRAENAALKAQMAHIKEIEFPTKCIVIANIWKNKITLLDETIAQQAAALEAAKYNYIGAMADCKHYVAMIEQQAEAIRLKDVVLEKIACIGNGDTHGNSIGNCLAIDALAIQPFPEILQARDERVAEACAKVCIEQSEGIARSTPVSRDRVHTLVENTMFKGIARPATVIDCSESSVRESAFRIRNGAWERHL